MENKLIKNIVAQFQDIQEQELWLDENFKKKINNLPAGMAFIRPLPELHSVAELVHHILIWRKESILKLKGLIHHDLYHLGQIGIVIKFLNLKN